MSLSDIAKRLRRKKLVNTSLLAFFSLMLSELVEEVLEDSIAFGITWLFAKAVSSLGIVFLVQFIKICGKKMIKKVTYKEGNDKMAKIKNLLKNIANGIWANKFSLLGTISAILVTLGGTGLIDTNTLPEIALGGANITPIIYYVLLGILSALGISKKGWETISEYFNRIAKEKALKEEQALYKEAAKEIAHEEKLNNQTVTEQEKTKAKEEAILKAKEEKEKAEAEKRAKIEAIKAELRETLK